MEKAKVSKEVAEVLDEVRGCHEPTIDEFIGRHAKGDVGPDWQVLKQYRTVFVAHLIYTGAYEVEKTPEEKVAAYYDELREEFEGEAMAAVASTLNLLGVHIEGVNA